MIPNSISQPVVRLRQSLSRNTLSIVMILRWPVLFGIFFRVQYTDPISSEVQSIEDIALLILLFYTLLVTLMAFEIPRKLSEWTESKQVLFEFPRKLTEWSENKRWTYFQVAFDIAIFSLFYLLTANSDSDFFLFYFLPLLVAAENLEREEAFLTFMCVAVVLAVVIFGIEYFRPETTNALVRTYLPRAVFFFFVLIFAIVRISDLRHKKERSERLAEIDAKLRVQTDLQTLLDMVCKECYEFFDAAGVHLRLAKNGQLEYVAGEGPHLKIVRDEEDVIRDVDDKSPGHMKAFVSKEKKPYIDSVDDDLFFQKLIGRASDEEQEFLESLKCFGCFPLLVGGEPIGVLTIRSTRADLFTAEVQNSVRSFALRAALAIQNATLMEEREERAQTFKALADSSLAVFRPEDLDERLQAIVKESYTLLKATGGKVFLKSDDDSFLVLAAIDGLGPGAPSEGYRMPIDKGLVGEVMRTGEPKRVANYCEVGEPVETFKNIIQSVVEVPMKLQGKTIGAIAVIANDEKWREFTDEDESILELFAERAATAIAHARSYQREQKLRQDEQKLREALEGLYDVNQVIASNFDLQSALERIAEQAYSIVRKPGDESRGYSHITLVAGNVIDYAATSPPEKLEALKNNGLVPLDLNIPNERIGIVGHVVETGETQNEGNVKGSEYYIKIDIGEDINSQISVPIKSENRVIGVLSVLHPDLDYFTKEDENLLEFLAIHALVAIKTSRLLSARVGLTALTMPIMRKQHDIGTEVSRITSTIGLLRLNHNIPHEKFLNSLDMIEAAARSIPMGDIRLPLTPAANRENIPIKDVIDKADIALRDRNTDIYYLLPEECKAFEIKDNFEVSCNPDWLSYAIRMVMANAIQAMDGKSVSEKMLGVTTRMVDDKGGRIEITNNGPRIENYILFKLFQEPFHKLDSTHKTSFGAFIAAEVIETYNGYIAVDSTDSEKTTVVIWLPCGKIRN